MALQCPSCDERLNVNRTYSAGSAGQAQETECPKCGKRFAAVTLVLREVDQWGLGAFAAADQLRRGALRLRINKRKLTLKRK
jgi:hypothetical protein